MTTSSTSLVLALVLLPLAAHAMVVTTTADEDDGAPGISLREAVKYSTTGETVTFAPALSGQTIRLSRGSLSIDRSLMIDASALPAGLILSGSVWKTMNKSRPRLP